jgi:glutathione synthase/RimK-type ligase-like ATP-grasp enzyme
MTAARYAVISAGGDGHLPFVQKHLDQPLVVIDPGKIIRGTPLSFRFIDDGFEAFYDGTPLRGISAVWYRKPEFAMPAEEPHQKGYDEFTRHAMSLFMRQLYGLLPDALWISNYYAIVRASDKLWQLTAAHKLGFKIPDTLVTSSALEAERFVQSHDGTVVKPIEVKVFTLNGKQRMMFTQKVDKQAPNFAGLHLAPAMVQEAVDLATDIRVTVVGDKVFAAAVAPKSIDTVPEVVRDWRVGDHYGGTDIRTFDLPPSVARMCALHAQEMGLRYSAIDLLLDKKGVFWFLENNPNGQWAFVEEVTGQPIGQAIAQLLMSGV